MIRGVYILLGSNLGDRMFQIAKAIEHIKESVGSVIDKSSLYETDAWGITDQPSFYNLALEICTQLSPADLLINILKIEELMGRERQIKWGERLIDIDILYYDNLILDSDSLIIPHPELQNRRFALEPLCEISPDFRHPVLHLSQRDLLQNCQDKLGVKLLQRLAT